MAVSNGPPDQAWQQAARPSQAPPPKPAPGLRRQVTRFPATFGLIGFTSLVFAGQMLSQQLLGGDILILLGAKVPGAIASGELWRLVTPIFLHVGLWHILVNMYSLYAIGPPVERFFGGSRMLAFYLLSGISGVAMSLAFSPHASVGASGAIFGLLGALVAFIYRHRKLFGRGGMLQFRQLVFVALLNLAIGLAPGIDNWGHLGGLVAGLGLTWFLGPQLQPAWLTASKPQLVDGRPWRRARKGILTAAILIFGMALAASFSPLVR